MKTKGICLLITLFAITGMATAQEHFHCERTDNNHSLLAMDCNIDGELLVEGDEVGAFDPQGVCAGVGLFNGGEDGVTGIALWRDDPQTEADEGFEEGDEFSFKFWDSDTDMELETEMEIREGSQRWERDGFTMVTLSAVGIPRMVAEEREHDFGLLDMLVDEPRVWEAEIANTGNGVLLIESIVQEGDTAGVGFVIADTVVERESSTVVTSIFPQGDYQRGRSYDVSYIVHSNAEDEVVYHFTGKIGVPQFMTDRDSIDMGEACPIDDGYNTPQYSYDSLLVTNAGSAILQITAINFTDSAFFLAPGLEFPIRIAPEGGYWIHVVFHPWDIEGYNRQYTAWMEFESNSLLDPVDQKIWIMGRAVFGIEVKPEQDQLPGTFELISAYPNPFNSMTTIRFLTGSAAHPTRLAVLGLDGRKVADLNVATNGGVAGERAAVWNAGGVPGGVYIVKLESGEQARTMKVVLLK